MKVITLNEDQKSLLSTSLRVAAEQYEHNASTVPGAPSYTGLADQFRLQAKQAVELATVVDNADSIEISTEE